jgi:LysM repeat protein
LIVNASPTAVLVPTAVPTPAPVTYRVRSGDTLGKIATRYKRTIGQIVTANAAITDPNHIEVGQLIVIPPFDAPDIPPSIAVVADPENDLSDEQGFDTTGPGYADLTGFAVRLLDFDLAMELKLRNTPPNVDPTVEDVVYVINIDTTGDGEPDYSVTYANNLPGQVGYQADLRNRSTNEEQVGALFPGTVEVARTSIKITVALSALGSPDQKGTFAAAASVQRMFRPDQPADSSVEQSVDLAPDQQWPRTNARWAEVAR